MCASLYCIFFFFNDTATTEIYTLSLHDALPISVQRLEDGEVSPYLTDELRPGEKIELRGPIGGYFVWEPSEGGRSEEHTSELQSQSNLVCRLLLEKKKKQQPTPLLVGSLSPPTF